MKKIFLLITMLALMPFAVVNAQEDGRQRGMATVVADGLAQLPAENAEVYNSVMAELAATGSEGVQMIADMLQVVTEGVNNSPMEYALSGVATYVTKADDELRAGVREGLKAAFAKEEAPVLKAYLMQTLEICATKEDVEFFAEQLNDEYLKEYAVHALATIDTSGALIWEVFQRAYGINIDKSVLSHIASYQHIPGAEGFLILWLKEVQDDNERAQIYHALASCGGANAEKVLAAAAKSVGYNFENTDAYGAYVTLLNRMVVENPNLATKGAKKLMKVEKNNVRLQGLDILARLNGDDVLPVILKGLKDESRDYRYGALLTANYFADEEAYAAIAAALPKVNDAAKVDILNYLGASHAESQIAAIVSQISSDCDCVAVAAIEAAGRIGGDEALAAIMAEVATESEGEVYDAAIATLLAFNGKIDDAVVQALDGNDASKAAALMTLEDFMANRDKYSTVVFLNAFTLSDTERTAIKKRLDSDKSASIWIYAPGLVTENQWSESAMKELTGMTLKVKDAKLPMALNIDNLGSIGNAKIAESPRIYVDDKSSEAMGMYSDKTIGMAKKGNVIFSGVPVNKPEVWAALLKKSGAHAYTKPGIFVHAVNPFILVHVANGGSYPINLPAKARKVISIYDNNQTVAQNTDSIVLQSKGCKTWLLKVEYK